MAERRPSILFIHVDQMHFQALSAYGNPYLRTPGMDRLVEDGCSFMAMHTVMPQCCPARASWYTGRMATEHGARTTGFGDRIGAIEAGRAADLVLLDWRDVAYPYLDGDVPVVDAIALPVPVSGVALADGSSGN